MISCLFKASKEGSTLKGKNLLPWKEFAPKGSKFFPFIVDPFSEGRKSVDRVTSPNL